MRHKLKLQLEGQNFYRIAPQKTDIAEDLRKASKLWEDGTEDSEEEETEDSEEEEGEHEKLVILLEHQYTEANMKFANLKGRDMVKADHLRASGAFEVHLALIVRHKRGSAEFDPGSYYKRRRGRWGGWGDSSESEGAIHLHHLPSYKQLLGFFALVCKFMLPPSLYYVLNSFLSCLNTSTFWCTSCISP